MSVPAARPNKAPAASVMMAPHPASDKRSDHHIDDKKDRGHRQWRCCALRFKLPQTGFEALQSQVLIQIQRKEAKGQYGSSDENQGFFHGF
jgi:hypothetical protein